MNGCRPPLEYMTFNFALVGIDQIINNAAKMRQMTAGQFPMPMVFSILLPLRDNWERHTGSENLVPIGSRIKSNCSIYSL